MSNEATSPANPTSNPTRLQRFNWAWEGAQSSFSVPIFGIASIIALVDHVFKLHEKAIKMGWIPGESIPIGVFIYILLLVWAARSFFLVAELSGKRKQIFDETKQAKDAVIKKMSAENAALHVAFECAHSVIHTTRDAVLSDGGFARLCAMDEGERSDFLYKTIQHQLGTFEHAMRTITGADCCTVLKIRSEDSQSLISACYGSHASLARRRESTSLPLNQGLAYAAIVSKGIVFSNDMLTDQRFWPTDPHDRGKLSSRYRTVVACPVLNDGTALAVLCFDWQEPGMYSEKYNQILACFTDVISGVCYIIGAAEKLKTTSGGSHARTGTPTETGV